MKLYFELENSDGDRRPFSYSLNDTPSTHKFYKVTKEALSLKDNFPHGLSFGFRPTEEDLRTRVLRMNTLIQIINDEGSVFIEGELTAAEKLTQDRLNYLHLKFHEYEESHEKKGKVDLTSKSLRELNILIHQIEQNRLLLKAPVFTQYLIFLLQKTIDLPMETEDHLGKTLELQHGDLMLGYCTVGKSLFHCYKDNDLCLVKSKMVRDQIIINSEVVCAFPEKDDGPDKAQKDTEDFYKWCQENRVGDYGYDYKAPLHRPGNIHLGKLEQNYSYQEITAIFRHYQKMALFNLR